jgi:tetratricopeptide (TPR) repeat protein
MRVPHSVRWVVVSLVATCLVGSLAGADDMAKMHGMATADGGIQAPLFDGLGKYHRAISTKSQEAQRYFDQGMNFLWGFNLHEAQRSFEQGARLDPSCAMLEWGTAMSLGPHFNVPALPPRTVAANAHAQKALTRLAGATPVERGLVEAVAKRYADPAPATPEDQKKLDSAYADAMKALMQKFPDDDDVAALWCEAMMDLRPWDLWTPDQQPQPGTLDMIAVLEKILARDPGHPGANHYYIHAVEPGPHPEKGLASADRLKKLDSSVGHLTHMPSHIYEKVGRYEDARVANLRALDKDRAYETKANPIPPESFYPMYTAHNAQFLAWTAMTQGRSADAIRYARSSLEKVPPEMIDMMPGFDIFLALPYLAYARFGKWDEILAEPAPKKYYPFMSAMRHYARGLAYAGKGQLAPARAELDSVKALSSATPAEATEANNSAGLLLSIAQKVLEGTIAIQDGKTDDGLKLLTEAARAEDLTRYDEPSDWLYPVRHTLGAQLLKANRAYEAELVYRADLERNKENGWALFGLTESLKKQGKTADAADAQKRFTRAWSAADVKITASSY